MSTKEKVIALGFFDGVHLGHAALLQRTVEEAAARGVTPAVFTFDRVPKEVITGIPCPLINSPEDRRDLLRRLYGIQDIIMVPFDDEMRTTSWDDFIYNIILIDIALIMTSNKISLFYIVRTGNWFVAKTQM